MTRTIPYDPAYALCPLWVLAGEFVMTSPNAAELTLPGEGLFFTSDTHFGHANIIKYCSRPFNSATHMDEMLISNWNETVGPEDTVFHLGDFCFGKPPKWLSILERLNGRIYLIVGNHDDRGLNDKVVSHFAAVSMQMRIRVDGQKIYLNHFPFLCFDGGYSNVWQLFGHVHSKAGMAGMESSRLMHLYPTQYDVGVDNNDYRPVSFSRICSVINAQIKAANGEPQSD